MQPPQMTIQRNELWPTIVWNFMLPEFERLNPAMLAAIEELRRGDPEGALGRSNPQGWQSRKILQTLPAFQPFFQLVLSAFAGPIAEHHNWDVGRGVPRVESWANVNQPGSYNKMHSHNRALLSGAYYLRVPADSGDISFYNTRRLFAEDEDAPVRDPSRPYPEERARAFKPQEGRVLLFPGWLPHDVDHNRSGGDRVSISFNIALHPRPVSAGG